MGKPASKPTQGFDYERVAELYLEVLALPTEKRTAFLHERAKGDTELIAQVESLLRSSNLMEFLEKPAMNSVSMAAITDGNGVPNFSEGDRIGSFVVTLELGKGGFANVYLAQDVALGRDVAIKVSRNSGQEARILAPLDHDNIVKVFSESVEDDGRLRVVCMQYISGTTLSSVIHEIRKNDAPLTGNSVIDAIRKLSRSSHTQVTNGTDERYLLGQLGFEETVLLIGVQLAHALAYAHRKGVLHLDVKPSNLLLNQSGRPFLTDFNVSWSLKNRDSGKHQTVGGTYNYMAPEHRAVFTSSDPQAAMREVDHRADVHSLGKVLLEFIGLIPLLDITEDVMRILEKSTANKPEDRFPSASAFAAALEGCLAITAIRRQIRIQTEGLVDPTRPFFVLKMFWLIPLAVASVASLWYGAHLCAVAAPAMKVPLLLANFGTLLLFYLWFPIVWTRNLLPLRNFIKEPKRGLKNPQMARKIRTDLLELPRMIFSHYSYIWLPVQILGPVGIHLMVKNLPAPFFGRLLIAYALVGLTTAAFSVIATQFIVVLHLYHYCWLGEEKVCEVASGELASVPSRMLIFYSVIVGLPFVGAFLLGLDSGPSPWGIIVGLIVSGGLAVFYSVRVSHRVAQVIFAFAGRRRAKD